MKSEYLFWFSLLENDGQRYQDLEDYLKTEEFIVEWVKSNKKAIRWVKDDINFDMALKIIDINPTYFSSFPSHLKNNKEIIQKIIEKDSNLLRYCPNPLNDKVMAMQAMKNNPACFSYIASSLVKKDKEVAMFIMDHYNIYDILDDLLKNDKDILIKYIAISKNGYYINLLESSVVDATYVEQLKKLLELPLYNKESLEVKIKVFTYLLPDYVLSLKEIEKELKSKHNEIKEIVELRKDEWLAKIEENKLRNAL